MPAAVPAALRAMNLFEVFAKEKRPLSNSELARLLDLPESSCSDLVFTLVEAGYVLRTIKTRKLYPTSRLLGVVTDISKNDPALSTLIEACELLRDKTGETTLCGRVEQGVVRVLAGAEGHHSLRYSATSDQKLSLHVSAIGKAILAQGTPEEALRQLRIKPLKKLASGTLTDLAKLQKQVARFREQGWALVEHEGGEDLGAMAMAGRLNGELVAICITGPVGRLKLQRAEHLKALQQVRDLLFEAPESARAAD